MNIDGREPELGILDVTLYRDDFRTRLKQPEVSVTDISFDITEKDIILIDSATETALSIFKLLKEKNILTNKKTSATVNTYITDMHPNFEKWTNYLTGQEVSPKIVDLETI